VNRYLLDTNHLSADLKRHAGLESRIELHLRMGDRFGITLPVLCEYRAGVALGKKSQGNLARLAAARRVLKLWPLDERTAIEFAALVKDLKPKGQMLGQFDALIAAVVRQHDLTLLTADGDFRSITHLIRVENWLT
jgi:predicted nucleic acid-binding protein